MINKEKLKEYAADLGISLDENAALMFSHYSDILVEVNSYMNLTAITESDEILIKHFIDSLEVLKYVDIPKGASIIDVGTGAGFPGVPLLIARNDIKLTLLDSLKKRIGFLETVIENCKLNASFVHSRAEDAGQNKVFRETFDFATARAVAPLNVLAEYCLPFVKVGGSFIALKGNAEDIEKGKTAVSLLGGEIQSIVSYELPNGDARTIVVIKKISQTPTTFPRNPKKIASSPLE